MFSRSLGLPIFILIFVVSGNLGFEYCEKEIVGEKVSKYGTEWLKFKDNCYFFDSRSDEQFRLSYYDAEDFCRSRGASLASIHSEEENEFINEVISKRYYSGRQWIGLNILSGEDKPRWSDGSPVDYLNFVNKTEYFKEKCFMFYKTEGGGWRKEHCELRHTPICKKSIRDINPTTLPPITPDLPKGNCPKEWLQLGQKCYKFFGQKEEERKKFKEAKLACIALGENHDLVSIHSLEEQAFLTQHLHDLGASAWIGLQQVQSDEIGHILVFGWTDNSRVNYTYWAPGHPKRGTWKNCASLGLDGVNKGEWLSEYCEIYNKGYICERPSAAEFPPKPSESSKCDGNATRYRSSCYKYYSTSVTWDEANRTCEASGSHLLSVTDSFEQAFLYNFLGQRTAWIGLKTVPETRIFQWADRQPFYYSNWAPGQPLLPKVEGSHCARVISTEDHFWKIWSCGAKLPFVCKLSDDEPDPLPPVVRGNCPPQKSSWIDIGDKYCYHVGEGNDDRYQWGSLSRYCISKGMELITLESSHQVNSLLAYTWRKPYDFWLGLIRTSNKKSFMWIDGSPFNYTNWEDREPSTYSTGKDCVSFSTRNTKWTVKDCSDWNGSICRAKKVL